MLCFYMFVVFAAHVTSPTLFDVIEICNIDNDVLHVQSDMYIY